MPLLSTKFSAWLSEISLVSFSNGEHWQSESWVACNTFCFVFVLHKQHHDTVWPNMVSQKLIEMEENTIKKPPSHHVKAKTFGGNLQPCSQHSCSEAWSKNTNPKVQENPMVGWLGAGWKVVKSPWVVPINLPYLYKNLAGRCIYPEKMVAINTCKVANGIMIDSQDIAWFRAVTSCLIWLIWFNIDQYVTNDHRFVI